MTKSPSDASVRIIAASLRPADMKALNVLRKAFSSFTSCSALPGISNDMAEALLSLGLAEKGTPEGCIGNPKTGYRLSDLGWRVREARVKNR